MSAMEYFGEAYPSDENPAPIYFDISKVDPPVGQNCLWCDEPIKRGERGFIQSALIRRDEQNELIPTREPAHHECNLRQVIGSAEHQRGECSCAGDDFTIEQAVKYATKREEARAALREFEKRNKQPTHSLDERPKRRQMFAQPDSARRLGKAHALGVKAAPYTANSWPYDPRTFPFYKTAYNKEILKQKKTLKQKR